MVRLGPPEGESAGQGLQPECWRDRRGSAASQGPGHLVPGRASAQEGGGSGASPGRGQPGGGGMVEYVSEPKKEC